MTTGPDMRPGGGTDATGPPRDASIAELISRLSDDVTVLLRQEVELAKAEIKQELARAAKAGVMIAVGAVLGLVTVLLLAWTVAWGLAELLPVWVAFLLTTVLFGAIAGGLTMVGKNRMSEIEFGAQRATDNLHEDKQVLNDRMAS